jgi:hypothetical protein
MELWILDPGMPREGSQPIDGKGSRCGVFLGKKPISEVFGR